MRRTRAAALHILVRLLGGIPKQIQAYGAVGFDGAQESAEAASEWVERGIKGIKAKIGYPTLHEDLEVIRAIRREVGDGVAIMVDYNQCLTPVEAIERVRVLDSECLTWVKEPTLAHDYRGHAMIAREVNTPIQCGETTGGAAIPGIKPVGMSFCYGDPLSHASMVICGG